MIKFDKSASLRPYNDMNIDLRKKAKNGFEKYFLKLINKCSVCKNQGKC